MPEKKVATTTTGIRIEGNKSTGIRTKLVMPTMQVIRQTTTIKYGYRMANFDTVISSYLFGLAIISLNSFTVN